MLIKLSNPLIKHLSLYIVIGKYISHLRSENL